jgi:hypothetical protein
VGVGVKRLGLRILLSLEVTKRGIKLWPKGRTIARVGPVAERKG